jgi:hypothetical protein
MGHNVNIYWIAVGVLLHTFSRCNFRVRIWELCGTKVMLLMDTMSVSSRREWAVAVAAYLFTMYISAWGALVGSLEAANSS